MRVAISSWSLSSTSVRCLAADPVSGTSTQSEEFAHFLDVPVEHLPHLKPAVSRACGQLGTRGGVGAHHIGRNVFVAAVGEDEAFLDVQVTAVVANATKPSLICVRRAASRAWPPLR